MKCRACKTSVIPFFSLGMMPLVNSFLASESACSQEKRYDLTVAFCPQCFLVQLMTNIAPETLFLHYVYVSSTSKHFLAHCQKTAIAFIKRFNLTSKHLVLEIGSNDGSQLQYFKNKGISVLGVDPAENIATIANKKGIRTIPGFLSLAFAQNLKQREGIQADLILGANVLAHVPNIVNFVKGVKVMLKPKGSAVFEFPYLKGLMEGKFDIIYHEHVFYYSLLALINLFSCAYLEIYDVEMTSMQGGSLRIFVSHQKVFPLSPSLKHLVRQEKTAGFDRIDTYYAIQKRIEALKKNLLSLLKKLKREGKGIAAYSAPAKGNVLLNYFGIHGNYLDFIVDKAKEKQGLFTPGTHLRVYSPEKIYHAKPDYLLVLCWNIADEVIEEHAKFQRMGGKFIIPIPELKII